MGKRRQDFEGVFDSPPPPLPGAATKVKNNKFKHTLLSTIHRGNTILTANIEFD